MNLIYSINFNSQNSYYLSYIRELLKDYKCDIRRSESKIFITLDRDGAYEALEYLGNNLPLSIFLGKGEECEKIDDDILPKESELYFRADYSPLLKDIKRVLNPQSSDYLNPLIEFDFFGYRYEREGECYISFDGEDIRDREKIFIKAIDVLKRGEILKVDTFFGTKCFSLKNSSLHPSIILKDSSKIGTIFKISQKEYLALSSIERPKITAQISKTSHDSMLKDAQCADIRYPFCAMEIILCALLEESDYIFELKSSSVYSAYLKLHGVDKKRTSKELKLYYVDDDLTICSGDRGVLKSGFKDHQDIALNIIKDKNLKKTTAIAYLSKDSKDSSFYAYREDIGFKKFMSFFEYESLKIENLFNDQDSTKDLLSNFNQKSSIEKINNILDRERVIGLSAYFGLFGLLCGIDANSLDESFDELFCRSLSYEGDRSVKIDMKMTKRDNRLYFDTKKTAQTLMSYRVASVSTDMLSYAILESFADFVSDTLNEICKQNSTSDAIIYGSIFENKMLTKRVLKHSSNLYNIHKPSLYPLDL